MSIPRNTPAAAGQDATPSAPAGVPAGRHARRRAVMMGNLFASTGLFFFAACSDRGLTEPGAPAAAAGGASRAVYSSSATTSSTSTTTSTSSSTSTSTSSTTTSTSSVSSSSSSGTAGDTARVTLTITPTTTATFRVNVHKVRIEAGSVCDPRTSAYGPAHWNTGCAPITSSLTITAKAWTDATGRPVVSFSPDVRFVPGKNNQIWLLDRLAAQQKVDPLTWCPTGQTACVNEAATDPDLKTSYTSDGFATRRIKHFSGFTVGFGRREK